MSAARRRPPRRPARDGGAVVRFHFFAGKGGVGKTTCAAAAALAAAESGRRVVVVSTDPAHSLGDALGRRVGPVTRRVPVRAGRLEAIELDADRALARWLARRRGTLRTIAERGTYLDEEDLERLLRLSFPGVDELMALVELGRLARQGRYELVVVDTAPTGHALRLLGMPETLRRVAGVLNDLYAKHRFLADSLGRGYRAGPADRLIEELDADGRRLAALLRDAERCRFTWLLLAEELTLEETRDGVAALAREGMRVGELLNVSPWGNVRVPFVATWSRPLRAVPSMVVKSTPTEPVVPPRPVSLPRPAARSRRPRCAISPRSTRSPAASRGSAPLRGVWVHAGRRLTSSRMSVSLRLGPPFQKNQRH